MSDRDIDQALVERVQKGDKKAFELLVVKYHKKLIRVLSRLVKDEHEIEDVAQEAFIKAYRALPSFRGESAFYTWLFRIGINTAKNYLVSMGRRLPTTTELEGYSESGETISLIERVSDYSTPEEELITKQLAEALNKAIEELPEDLRVAITLREIDGLSYDDIAAVMDCPIGTVRSRIFRARDAIADKLKPLRGDDEKTGKRW